MRSDYYPRGTVQALLLTDIVTPATRNVLKARLERLPVTAPVFFDATSFVTLKAVCARIIPQPDQHRLVDLAGCLDGMLAEGKGNGWRYNAMPSDGKAFTMGLPGVDQSAVAMFDRHFYSLAPNEQDEVLISIQSGAAKGLSWDVVPPILFFEELLAALAEMYYSHPFAKEDIGEVAMADAAGWQKIGLNERDPQEPQTLKDKPYA